MNKGYLIFTYLSANSADHKLIFFLIFLRKQTLTFQLSTKETLHEMSNSIFCENEKKYHHFVVCWICPYFLFQFQIQGYMQTFCKMLSYRVSRQHRYNVISTSPRRYDVATMSIWRLVGDICLLDRSEGWSEKVSDFVLHSCTYMQQLLRIDRVFW